MGCVGLKGEGEGTGLGLCWHERGGCSYGCKGLIFKVDARIPMSLVGN